MYFVDYVTDVDIYLYLNLYKKGRGRGGGRLIGAAYQPVLESDLLRALPLPPSLLVNDAKSMPQTFMRTLAGVFVMVVLRHSNILCHQWWRDKPIEFCGIFISPYPVLSQFLSSACFFPFM